MPTNRINVKRGSPIYVRLIDIDDSGFVDLNGNHYALALDETKDITPAMKNGINRLRCVVENKGTPTPIGNMPPGPWKGRFELFVNNQSVGVFADEGNDGLGKSNHIVADVEIIAS